MKDEDYFSYEWIDKDTGYECVANRGALLFWVAYVCIPDNHPFADILKKGGDTESLEVHGGVTFNGYKQKKLCIGFNCGHASDLLPENILDLPGGFKEMLTELNESKRQVKRFGLSSYKDINFVMEECSKLAKQLKELENE